MTIAELEDAAQEIIRLLRDYSTDPAAQREMRIDPVVYGYFDGRFGKMSRQVYVRMHSRPRPQRIDFRYGSNNPLVFEFAVRSRQSDATLYGSQNVSELRKLTRVIPSQARTRILLLLDLTDTPIARDNLKATYDRINAGRGRFQRHPVRVIYASNSVTYNFLWRPQA